MTQFQVVRFIRNTQPPPPGWSLMNPSIDVVGGNWVIHFIKSPSGNTSDITVVANPTELQLGVSLTAGYALMLLIA